MQAFNQEYDYGKRAEYQVARLETTYLRKGDSWEKAPTVYQISVLDFNFGSGDRSPISRYAMRTKEGEGAVMLSQHHLHRAAESPEA